jgi:hypothetical protein
VLERCALGSPAVSAEIAEISQPAPNPNVLAWFNG